ncbi:hypothetical protein LTR84_007180 [Exophiala bonariae]|uniref:FAD-binding PCMH-type domain-containing protein n=1 Tax=Exophiala bonariae TaxID=1690606 RepID=A0AAV9MZ13_9EURO|nr:hypothetical protein LTR84_007180 [Exophiala bonariae]
MAIPLTAGGDEWDHGILPLESSSLVKECILGLTEKVNEKELPGWASLVADWWNPNILVSQEQSIRRFLRIFKHSEVDHTYQDLLKNYDDETQHIFEAFVDGKIDAEEASKLYHPYHSVTALKPAGGCRNGDLSTLNQNDRQNIALQGYADLLRAFPTSIPSRIRRYFWKRIPFFKQEKHKLRVKSYYNLNFRNHGRTIHNTPAITCVPETTKDIQDIVKFAKAHKMGVRVSGFRHSWSPVFGRLNTAGMKNNGDILISTLGLIDATILPNFTSMPTDIFQPHAKDLNSITIVEASYVRGPALTNGAKYVRLGTSTTNKQLRKWCIEIGKVTLPLQIIEVEITMGGSNATICHGAGLQHPTLSDLVRAIEYVDANGNLNKIDLSTPSFLRAAAGCFGLIGIVTHLTLEFDAMSCALLVPRKIPVIEAIPPPLDMPYSAIPPALRPAQPLSKERQRENQEEFERRALNDYYAEWFWFPYSSEVWVNTWSKTTDLSNAVTYPNNGKIILQVFGTFATQIIQNATILLKLTDNNPERQTKLLSWLAMKNLDDVGPGGNPIKTWLTDALHFQRGVQNLRVRDMEVELPLQPKERDLELSTRSDSRGNPIDTTIKNPPIDFSVVQRAWWDAIIECYRHIDTCPQRMPLEMRIMGNSNITLAPQRGYTLGTCSIEIVTLSNTADIWPAYAQKVLDRWSNYKDERGNGIPVRPHWAKEWYGYTMRGRRWEDFLKEEEAENGGFKAEFEEWRDIVGQLASRDGWDIEIARDMFGNEVLNELIWSPPRGTASTKAMSNG